MVVFGGMVIYFLRKKATKLILCFICVIDIMRSLCFPCLCLYQLRIFVHPLVRYITVIWPFLKNSDFYYTVYCAHRYAVIVDHLGIFNAFKRVTSLSCILVLGVVYGYLVECHAIIAFILNGRFSTFRWYVTFFIVRAVLMFGQTTLHWYAVRAITKKLNETINFMKSLPDSHRHGDRLKALANIKRFNKALFFLQIFMPTLEIIRHVFSIFYIVYCKKCDPSLVAEFEADLLPHLNSALLSTRSIIFVTLHFLYYKVFTCSGTTES